MNRTRQLAIALYLLGMAIVIFAPSARAAAPDGVAVAERYWGPHRCSGKVVVVYDATIATRGEVRAVWVGDHWSFTTTCDIHIKPGLPPEDDCYAKVHEIGHRIRGPVHDGPMSEQAIRAVCPLPTRAQRLERTIREGLPRPPTWRVRCRRSRCVARAPWAKTRHYRYRYVTGSLEWWAANPKGTL